jgi:predicted CxxxxCH...CXXCH cytochrome family protein
MYHTSTLPQFDPDPVWSTDSLRCANVYCHGYFKNGNTDNAPLWTDITGTSAACGTCHGDPQAAGQPERAMPKTAARGGTHPVVSNCGCHSDVVDANYKIINKQKHMNGRLNVYGSEYDF